MGLLDASSPDILVYQNELKVLINSSKSIKSIYCFYQI